MKNKSVQIIVLNWNQKQLSLDCIESLKKTSYNNIKKSDLQKSFKSLENFKFKLLSMILTLFLLEKLL